MRNYYSIRVVRANNEAQAIQKVMDGIFNEEHHLCDKVIKEDYFTSPTLVENMKTKIVTLKDKLKEANFQVWRLDQCNKQAQDKLSRRNTLITDLRGQIKRADKQIQFIHSFLDMKNLQEDFKDYVEERANDEKVARMQPYWDKDEKNWI